MTFELQDFVSQLRALADDSTDHATLEHIEERIGLTIALDAGHATVEGFLAEQTAGRLSFRPTAIDRSSLRETLAQLEAIVDAFPARGRLNDRSPSPAVGSRLRSDPAQPPRMSHVNEPKRDSGCYGSGGPPGARSRSPRSTIRSSHCSSVSFVRSSCGVRK